MSALEAVEVIDRTLEVRASLELIDRKIDEAAAALVPVMTGTLVDQVDVARAVHDALNSLASARLRAGLAAELLEVRP